ncbi:hypothetical protein [Dyadobacter frigoris]|uniref:Uncharacterized protein n=1 Tax=Dyadobacter frigoris TaxID=2576211 RepID=A0A4U6CLZ7_9BACT|nr:hypothetical protein [Dyadobacter frigoris]TKT85320.1 hypothetical protein FDK13_33975 [Dyadobacter frigoris]GLU56949.1 hypothetical protein Dfri01_64100 [Dyadobacter frigoris]
MNKKQFLKKAFAAALVAVMVCSSSALFAQVKIGANPTSIATGSALEVEASDKGVRLPQVSLTSTIVFAPVLGVGTAATSPGMTVYNTNPAITFGKASNGTTYPESGVGEYYWDGFGWVTQNATKGYRLVWGGSAAGPFHSVTGGPQYNMLTTEQFDSFNAGSGGVFTAPFDAFYTVTQTFRVKYTGPTGSSGVLASYINVTPLATGTAVTRSQGGGAGNFGFTIGWSHTVTLSLKTGDKITFAAQPCSGCVAGSNYDVTDLDQTIAVFQ